MNEYNMTVRDIIVGLLSADNKDIVKLYNKKEDKYYSINFVDLSPSARGQGQVNIEFNWDK